MQGRSIVVRVEGFEHVTVAIFPPLLPFDCGVFPEMFRVFKDNVKRWTRRRVLGIVSMDHFPNFMS